jgi:hypothetical protein
MFNCSAKSAWLTFRSSATREPDLQHDERSAPVREFPVRLGDVLALTDPQAPPASASCRYNSANRIIRQPG